MKSKKMTLLAKVLRFLHMRQGGQRPLDVPRVHACMGMWVGSTYSQTARPERPPVMNTLSRRHDHMAEPLSSGDVKPKAATNKVEASSSLSLKAIERMTVYAGGGAFLGVGFASLLSLGDNGTMLAAVASSFIGIVVWGFLPKDNQK
jgi:hypothetical protein